jgi:iron complex outermembrane recepter protein
MSRSYVLRAFLGALVTSSAIVIASPACAQEAVAEQDKSSEIPEIVVTAEKRSVSLQHSAIAVTAVTGTELEDKNVTDVMGLTGSVPGLSVSDGFGSRFTIRGISETNFDTNVDDKAAVHVDGVFSSKPFGANIALFDIDRVEVLRGPQGTLYGQNAVSGVVNIIPNRPGDYSAASANVGAGNYGRFEAGGMVNVPLTDTLQIRAAFQSIRHDGYLDQNSPGTIHFNDQDSLAGRVALRAEPTDQLTVQLSANYSHEGGNGPGQVLQPSNQANQLGVFVPQTVPANKGFLMPTYYGNPYGGNADFLGVPQYDTTIWGVHGQLDWKFADDVALTFIPAYGIVDFSQRGVYWNVAAAYHVPTSEWSNELRLASTDASDRLQWTFGLYQHRNISPYYSSVNAGNAFGIPNFRYMQSFPNQNSASYAAFGQGTYSITNAIRFTAGARISDDQKSIRGFVNLGNEGTAQYAPAIDANTIAVADNAKTWYEVTWKGELDADLTSKSLAYLSITTGTHAGGFYDTAAPNIFDPEKTISYEIGSKNRAFDNRLQLNGDVFFQRTSDYQVEAVRNVINVPGTAAQPATVVANIGQPQTIYGLEAEVIALVTKKDRFDLLLAYLHAYYSSGLAFVINPGQPTQLLGGLQLPGAPRWNTTLSYQHDFDLPSNYTLAFHVDSNLVSSKWLTFDHEPFTEQPSFTRTDARLVLGSPANKYEFEVWVKNLEDKAVNEFASTSPFGTGVYTNVMPPRTFGVNMRAKLK